MGVSKKSSRFLMAVLAITVIASLFLLGPKNNGLLINTNPVEFDEQAILERAYEDVRNAEELPPLNEELIIKIFDEDNNLIESMTLLSGAEVADEDFRKLINQSTLLAEYSTSKIYQLNK